MPRNSLSAAITAVAALTVLTVGIRHGTFAAADTDPYGYVSEADLMARGVLEIDQRFVSALPWPHADLTFTPPGYVARADGFIVPVYSPGLPIVMSVFQRVRGREAVFYVVPLLAALAVWMTGRLGARVDSPLTGALASVLLGSSAIFVFESVQPVSDVAVTAWWATSLALTVADAPLAALGAGLAASMAVMTRPNLVPLAAVIALFFAWKAQPAEPHLRKTSMSGVVLFCLGVVPGCLAVAAINQRLYGSPLLSGYGSLAPFYSWANLRPNLIVYPRWLIHTNAQWIAVAVAAPWLFRRRDHVFLLLTFSAGVFVSYVFYVPWGLTQWDNLRFLLPAFPALIVLSVAVARELIARLVRDHRVAVAAATAVCAALTIWQSRQAQRLGAFATEFAERRYVDVGRYAATGFPANAIFITGAEAGSLRYYSNRATIRFDLLDPGWLDKAIDVLREKGQRPYLVLEEAEEAPFRDRFAALNTTGRLDWPALVERSEPIVVRIYDPAGRRPFLAGEPAITGSLDVTRTPRVTTR